MFNLEPYLADRRNLIEQELDRQLPGPHSPPRVLHEVMRYAVLGGGKRLRPILCLAAAEAVGGLVDTALLPALAVEIFHTYTLVHDDLPAMDDDSLRRGRPTCHVVYGEANAILAGDALLTLAFEWLARSPAPPSASPHQYVLELARAGGSEGVIAGQFEDLAAEGRTVTAEQIEYIHEHKTAALLRAAVRIGVLAGGGTEVCLEALSRYGILLGLAFQLTDDLLNATSTRQALGKSVGTDQARGKATYVSLLGPEASRAKTEELCSQALACLREIPGNTEPLKALADYIVHRSH